MEIIKEQLDIDFEIENRPLSKEEEKIISEFIFSQKQKKEEIENKKLKSKKIKEKYNSLK